MKKTILALLFVMMLNTVIALDIDFYPSTINLCGSHQQFTTLYVNATNTMNSSLAETAKLYFAGSPGINFISSQSLSLNFNAFEKKSMQWTVQCSSPVSGTYESRINFTGTIFQNEEVTEFIVHESAFDGNLTINSDAVTEETPVTVGDNTPTVNVKTTRDSVCRGSLDNDEPYNSMDFIFYGSEKQHDYTFPEPVTNGLHRVYVKCMDAYNYIMPQSLVFSFIIDTSSPVITLEDPEIVVVGENTDLKVIVNEESVCRFDKSDKSFESMSSFDLKTGNTFTERLYNLEEKAYEYYIKCRDKVGNLGTLKASFEVQIPPKATITYEKSSPLPKGTFQITLEPSKELRETPKLYYTYTDDSEFKRDVNLEKEGDEYIGYIIIEDQVLPRSGVFNFLGYDLHGNEGKEIIEGAAFLVDTIKPNAPTDVQISAVTNQIMLNWYYEGEQVTNYNIYRSLSNNVGHTDLYDTTAKKEYTDNDVQNNQIYYYRIAAVDKAGNVGAFSNEVNIYAKSTNEVTLKEEIPSNPPTKETKEWKDKLSKDIETLLIDLSWAESNLREQASKESSVDELSLQKKISDGKQEIEKLKSQVLGIDLVRVSDTELREMLSIADALIARTKKTTPESLEVIKTTSFLQSTSQLDIETAARELYDSMKSNFSEAEFQSYLKQMKKINDKVRVESFIKTVAVKFLDDTVENRIIIKKEFNYDSEPISAYAYEVVPKTVAGDISGIDIKTPDYFVVNEDPVISWYYSSLGFEKKDFTYVILANDDSESAKSVKTVILTEPKVNPSLLTGFAVKLSEIKNYETVGVIFGIIIVLGLGLYYMALVKEVDFTNYIPKFPKLQEKIKETKGRGFLSPANYFHVKNGEIIRDIGELKFALMRMDDFTFYYHAHEGINDFSDWVSQNYDSKLASKIRKAKTKEELINLLG